MFTFRLASLALLGAMMPAVSLSQGQSVGVVLDSLYAVAHNHNPGHDALHTRSAILHLRPSQIVSFDDPEIEFMWQALPLETASGPVRSQWHLRQRLPRFGAVALERGIAEEAARVAAISADANRLDLNLKIKRAFIELYGFRQLQRLLESYQGRLLGFVDAARVQYAVATGTQAALLRIQLEKNALESTRLRLGALLDAQQFALTRLLGTGAGDLPHIAEWPMPPRMDLETEDLLAVALERRPEFRIFDSELRQSELGAYLVRKELWPSVAAGISWLDIKPHRYGDGGADALGIRVSASIPLSRSQTRARMVESVLADKEIAARKDAFLQALTAAIATRITQLSRHHATLELYDEGLLPQAEVVLHTTLSSYASGQADFLDLLDAERTRYRLNVERIDAVTSLLQTIAELEYSLGITDLNELPIHH
ncbi:MAG: TolC family protein [Bacteroidota bacterium]|nr:TolC family protein [Bacteroidota bacterium]